MLRQAIHDEVQAETCWHQALDIARLARDGSRREWTFGEVAADACQARGLNVAPLLEETRAALRTLLLRWRLTFRLRLLLRAWCSAWWR